MSKNYVTEGGTDLQLPTQPYFYYFQTNTASDMVILSCLVKKNHNLNSRKSKAKKLSLLMKVFKPYQKCRQTSTFSNILNFFSLSSNFENFFESQLRMTILDWSDWCIKRKSLCLELWICAQSKYPVLHLETFM